MKPKVLTKPSESSTINGKQMPSNILWSHNQRQPKNDSSLDIARHLYTHSSALQENTIIKPLDSFKEALKVNFTKSFRMKIPYFPKRPFGKHDNLNNLELNFIEMDVEDNTHHLFEKNSKFYKIVCGRASSVGRRRDKSRTFMKNIPSRYQNLLN